MKRTLILASVCTCLLAASTAQSWATIVIVPGVSWSGTMADWAGSPAVTIGTTTWTLDTLVPSTLPALLSVELDNLTGLRVTDNNGSLTTGTYTLNYGLSVTAGGLLLTTVKVDSTLNSGTDTITKNIFASKGGSLLAGPVISLNGTPTTATITGAPSSIYVSESIVIAGTISDFANTYTAVPEPTTMIAGALLLLPFGASTLRVLRTRRTA